MTTILGYKPWLPTHQIFVNSPKIFITPWISNMDPRDATSASKKVTKVEMSAVFDVFAFCGKRTKADYKDWAQRLETLSWKSNYRHENFFITFPGTWSFIMGLLEMTTQTVWFDSVEKEEQNSIVDLFSVPSELLVLPCTEFHSKVRHNKDFLDRNYC